MFLLPAVFILEIQPRSNFFLSKTLSFPVLWMFHALVLAGPDWFLTQSGGNSIDSKMYLGLCFGVFFVINAYVWGHASSFLLRRLLARTRRGQATSPTAPIK